MDVSDPLLSRFVHLGLSGPELSQQCQDEYSKINLAIGGVSDYPQLLKFESYWNGEKSSDSIKTAILDAIKPLFPTPQSITFD